MRMRIRIGKWMGVLLVVLFGGSLTAWGQWGGEVRFTPGKQLIMDEYSRQWIHERQVYTVAAELTHTAVPSDSD
ncbi:MAG: hypothetical protein IKO71_04095, partial [Bacteroidaceae bacterium]|nr:hypothetical protein [Bacteroidaceae bacterium]